jgi:two-component system phosphate regulon response regulator PhoB
MPTSILVIDDDPDVCDLLVIKLGRAGYQVTAAHTADRGLRLARRLRPALLLLDWALPGRSGLELAGQLRDDPATAAIPVVMLSAHAGPDHRQRAHAAGIVHYVVKPFSPRALAELIAGLVEQPATAQVTAEPAGALRADGLAWLAQPRHRPAQPATTPASAAQ